MTASTGGDIVVVVNQNSDSTSDACYRRWWLMVATALISAGLLEATAASLVALVDSFAGFALLGAAVMLLVRQTDLPIGRDVGSRELLMGALLTGTLACTVSGLTSIMGASAIVVAVAVLIASPWVVGADWQWMDCDLDTVILGLGYPVAVPSRFHLPNGVTPNSDAEPTIDWDELLGNQDGR